MPVDLFMQVDGVLGESADAQHRRWVDLLSLDFGIAVPTYSGMVIDPGNAVSDTSNRPRTVTATARMSIVTPQLMALADAGTSKTIICEVVSVSGGNRLRIARLELSEAKVVGCRTSIGGGREIALDSYEFAYSTLKVSTYTFNAAGQVRETQMRVFEATQQT